MVAPACLCLTAHCWALSCLWMARSFRGRHWLAEQTTCCSWAKSFGGKLVLGSKVTMVFKSWLLNYAIPPEGILLLVQLPISKKSARLKWIVRPGLLEYIAKHQWVQREFLILLIFIPVLKPEIEAINSHSHLKTFQRFWLQDGASVGKNGHNQ